jgi:hypothetical protein
LRSVEYHHAALPPALLNSLLAELQALPMPPVFAPLVDERGMDGSDYEFALNSPFEVAVAPVVAYLRYHWWSDPPLPLRPLADYCRRWRTEFDLLLPL